MAKFKFTDPITPSLTYTFEISPDQFEGPPLRKRLTYDFPTAPNSSLIIFEGRDEPRTIRFSGKILSSAQYDAMKTWFNKRYNLWLDDDRGIRYTIYITSFDPKRERSRSYPYKYSYVAEALVSEGSTA